MYDIIVNPLGGKGKSLKALKAAEKIFAERGVEYTVHNTEYAGHATELARELSRKPEAKILVFGGDGSFNEVLNGIENFENVTLGIVPCGTGNDFVRASGHPTKIKEAIDLILKDNVGYIDYIDVGSRRCLNVAGAGMDVDVLLRYATMKAFRGKLKYYASLIDTLIHVKWHKLRLTIDGKTMDKSVFMIGVGNGTCIGGGMPICPDAKVDDGLLSVVIVNEMKKSRIPVELPGFLSGKHVKKDYTEVYSAKEVTVEVLDDGKIELDGEVIDDKILECKVVHNVLKVYR
mgnify:CR=1 FL=1